MVCLDTIKEKIENKKIAFYEVSIPLDSIKNGIQFTDIDSFMKFVNEQKINTIFTHEYFDNPYEYIITDDIIEKTIGRYFASEMKDIIINDIDKHNRCILKIDFDRPFAIVIACIYEGQYCFVYMEDDNTSIEKLLVDPTEKLQEIIEKNEKNIQKREEKKKQILEKLKIELRHIIINDEKFLLCTNKHLRKVYIKELFDKRLDKHFNPLKDYWTTDAPIGVFREAIDFIEIIWKEIKQS